MTNNYISWLRAIDLGHNIELRSLVCISINVPNCILKLTAISDKWYLYTLILISKKCFSTQQRFLGQILIFEQADIMTERQKIQEVCWQIYCGIHILRYYSLRKGWVIVPKTPLMWLFLRNNVHVHAFYTKIWQFSWENPFIIHIFSLKLHDQYQIYSPQL